MLDARNLPVEIQKFMWSLSEKTIHTERFALKNQEISRAS